MGRVVVKIKLTNLADRNVQKRGLLKGAPRSVEIEALVDTGATGLCLKRSVIQALGLDVVRHVFSHTANGVCQRAQYEPVEFEVQGRAATFDVIEVPDTVPNLMGQIPLEVLDFVVDPRGQRLIGNPAHGGEWIHEEY